jgi:hypothetical protein
VELGKESVPGVGHGHTLVGVERRRLTELELNTYKGVLIRCPGQADPEGLRNEVPVWVGGSGVTADSTDNGGIPILPGSSIFIPIEKPNHLWVISTQAGQDVAWMVI